MNFERVCAILKSVHCFDSLCGKFSRFACGDEADAELVGERAADDKSA